MVTSGSEFEDYSDCSGMNWREVKRKDEDAADIMGNIKRERALRENAFSQSSRLAIFSRLASLLGIL